MLLVVSASQHFVAVKVPAPPPVQLPVSGPVWARAVQAREFVDFTARRGTGLPTTAYLLYDDKNLYVAFHNDQAGVAITAAQRLDNAGVGNDDHVAFLIDTAGNGTRTYQFRVNPLGVHDEASSENARYAPPWESAAHLDPNGDWDAILVIPLNDIRAGGGSVQQWRFNFERFIAGRNEDQTWAYEPAMQSITNVEYWPWLTGIHIHAGAARPKPQADAYVLGSAGSDRDIFQNGVGEFEQVQPRIAGLDVTYPFTNTLAFVGTLSPDFSNVDQDQTTIQPQEFQKVYVEYRPFFAQGAQYINAIPVIGAFGGNTMFYTPSIGIFNRGLKIEGTAGSNALGALNVVGPGLDDNAFGYAYTTPDESLTLSAQGVLANHTDIRDATTGYGLAWLNRHSGMGTQFAFSEENNNAGVQAHDFNIVEGLQNQHFIVAGYYRDTSPEYGPIDGYTATNDARGPALKLGYNGTGSEHSQILSYSLSVTSDRYLATNGTVQEADINAFYNLQLKDLLSFQGFFGPSELQVSPGTIEWFNRRQIGIGYRLGTPQPLFASYTWGPFSGYYVQQTSITDSRVFGQYVVSLEYDGNIERPGEGLPISNSQWLRRLALTRSFGHNASLGIGFRSINGTGGTAEPGSNLSLLYQQRFPSQDLLYLEYGTPSAPQTLDRFIVKYVFHAGGGTGT